MAANRLPIQDRAAIQRLVSALVDEAGSQNKAAAMTGIAQPTLSRLLNGTTDELDVGTFQRLLEAVGGWLDGSGRPHPPWLFTFEPLPKKEVQLERLESRRRRAEREGREFLEEVPEERWWSDQAQVEQRYEWWLDLEAGVLGPEGSLILRNYAAWLEREVRRTRAVVARIPDHAELLTLLRESTYQPVFESFAERTGRTEAYPTTEDLRYWIAIYRAIEPLAAGAETWGLELGWREMHDRRELRSYLTASLEREAILMEREPDLRRAAGIDPPMTEDQWLAATLGGETE